jgi:hypothetical protein
VCLLWLQIATARQAFATAEVPLDLASKQLHDLVKRQRKDVAKPGSQAAVTIAEMRASVDSWQEQQPSYSEAPLHKLLVLSTPSGSVVEESRVYVPFSCRGMLERLRGAQGQKLKLVVDMKQKVLTNQYGVITLAFLVNKQATSWSPVVHTSHVRRTLEVHTSTAVPFLQCLVHSEEQRNYVAAFQDAIWLCKEYGGVDLKMQLIQIHKDYAKGIEGARREVFPGARALDDYFHMKQAVQLAP